MKNERDKIDLLLELNADKQLQKVDWDKLNSAISSRLDEAQKLKASVRKHPIMFKIAAGLAAAAAVVLITIMIKSEGPAEVQLSDGRTAMVKFVDSKGSASIAIINPSEKVHVKVDIAGKDKKLAKCYVQIIDSSAGQREKEDIRPSWFIICRSEPVYADNGVNRDMMGMIYLF